MLLLMEERLTQASPKLRSLRQLYREAGEPSRLSLGRKVGLTDKSVGAILEGTTHSPKERDVDALISVLNEMIAGDIEEVRDARLVLDLASSYAVRAFRGVLAAGSLDDEPFYEEEEPYEVQSAFFVGGPANADRHVVVRVSGPSLEPRVQSGERILFYLDPTPIPRAITFVESPDGRKMVKVIRTDGAKTMLASINSAGASITDTKGWSVLGYAVMILGHEDAEGRNFEWRYGKPLRA